MKYMFTCWHHLQFLSFLITQTTYGTYFFSFLLWRCFQNFIFMSVSRRDLWINIRICRLFFIDFIIMVRVLIVLKTRSIYKFLYERGVVITSLYLIPFHCIESLGQLLMLQIIGRTKSFKCICTLDIYLNPKSYIFYQNSDQSSNISKNEKIRHTYPKHYHPLLFFINTLWRIFLDLSIPLCTKDCPRREEWEIYKENEKSYIFENILIICFFHQCE